MVSNGSDQIAEEASSEAVLEKLLEEERKEAPKKKGVKSEVWCVKPKTDDRQDSGSSAVPVNMVLTLPPI